MRIDWESACLLVRAILTVSRIIVTKAGISRLIVLGMSTDLPSICVVCQGFGYISNMLVH